MCIEGPRRWLAQRSNGRTRSPSPASGTQMRGCGAPCDRAGSSNPRPF
jgi:hypothetical protein